MKEKARTNYLLEFGVPGAQKTGGHRDPPLQDFIQVDVGRTRLFFAVSKSRDSLCAQSRFRDKKEKARTNCLLEFGVPGGTKNGRAQRPAPTRFYPSRCREDKAVFIAK